MRDGPAMGPAGASIPGVLSKAAMRDESRLTYGGSVAGRPRNAAAARWYSASATSRPARVATDSALGWGRSRYTAGLSGPTTTENAPTGLIPARFRPGTRAPFAYSA